MADAAEETVKFFMRSLLLILGLASIILPVVAQSKKEPQMFAEGVISTGQTADELFISFTPDMKNLYFTKRLPGGVFTIYFSQTVSGRWSEPQVAPFSGKYKDQGPFVSPDGKRIFFYSNRPLQGDKPRPDNDLWVVEKTTAGWGTAKHLGPQINSDLNEAHPSVDRFGNLYFWVFEEKSDGFGKSDIYVSRPENGEYRTAQNLGNQINSHYYESSPFVSPDGRYLLFCRDDVPGDLGKADIYISYFRKNNWTTPRPLKRGVNSSQFDFAPLVSPDKKYFFFSSNRLPQSTEMGRQNIYFMKIRDLGLELK